MIVTLTLCSIALVATIVGEALRDARIIGLSLGSLSLALIAYTILSVNHYPVMIKLYSVDAPLYVDNVSALMIINVVVLGIMALISSYRYIDVYGRRGILYYTLLLIFVYSMIGVLLVDNWLTFLLFWEAMTISSYMLITYDYNDPRVRNAGTLYVLTCHAGALLLTIGIALLYAATGSLSMLHAVQNLNPEIELAIMLMFFGFAVKAGLAPIHFWLPYAHPAAPSPVSALLSGAMVELGAYGTYRLVEMIKVPIPFLAYTIGFMSFASMVAALIAYWSQSDLKRLFAWSTIDHVGWMFIPIALACVNRSWINGAGIVLALYVLNHGVAKAAAFLTTGYTLYSYGSRSIDELRGLSRWDGLAAFLLGASIFAIEGLPPFNLFFPKIFVILACIRMGLWYIATFLAILWCLSFVYYVMLFNKSCLEPPRAPLRMLRKPSATIYIPIVLLIIFAVISNFVAQWMISVKG